jgi:TolA-binding protein
VVDATKFLLAVHPGSAALPKALLACANIQQAEGRADLANQTLRHVVVKFPLDPLSEIARRRLQEIEVG